MSDFRGKHDDPAAVAPVYTARVKAPGYSPTAYQVFGSVAEDHIDHTPMVLLFCTGSTASNACYVSEVQCSLGYSCSRGFNRASVHTPTSSRLNESGKLEYYAAAAPTVTTDPVFGQAFVAGDRVMKDLPVVETATGSVSFMTLGWTYDGAAWQPMQVQTGLVGIPS